MRILIATSSRNLVGGIEKYLQALIPGLLDRGHELGLLYENRFDPKRERSIQWQLRWRCGAQRNSLCGPC